MTKCDFCTESNSKGYCCYISQAKRRGYCEKAIEKMVEALQKVNIDKKKKIQ